MSAHRGADRGWLGAGLGLAGAVMLFLGWFGASGANTVAEQVPYLASGSIPGAALVVAAAIMWTRESAQRTDRHTDALIAELHGLLVEEAAGTPVAPAADTAGAAAEFVAIAGSPRFHRPSCAMVAGKAAAAPVDVAAITARHLTPCELCEPRSPAD